MKPLTATFALLFAVALLPQAAAAGTYTHDPEPDPLITTYDWTWSISEEPSQIQTAYLTFNFDDKAKD